MPHAETTDQPARKKRGGARQGTGPKAADGATDTKRVQLVLDENTLALFKLLGGGNVSLGARQAARLAARHAGSLAGADTHPAGV